MIFPVKKEKKENCQISQIEGVCLQHCSDLPKFSEPGGGEK